MNSRSNPAQRASLAHSHWGVESIVAALRESREVTHKIRYLGRVRELPSREAVQNIIKGLSAAMFPTHYGHADLTAETIDYYVGTTLSSTLAILVEQVRRALCFVPGRENCDDDSIEQEAIAITREFADGLPAVRALLVSDIRAAYQGDPAAGSTSEVLLCYPGVTAIIAHRIAHPLYKRGVPLLARLITEIAHSQTGIDIHPGAQIGESFFIDHGTGVVIGETAIIGRNVRLYQQVTLGAKRFAVSEDGSLVKGNLRHPLVEDDVVIYAGATILGRVTIGRGSVIGGNVWLTRDVPPNSQVSQVQCAQV
ncbi:serine O-acetyltransferase EpsC [Paenalcaligenes suwonensis]|uniref:serine O-acetyltransferase EpsC n=1 Tax=Paenalcaligenes suwonensis TaxID=1202713 RepID=UPI00140E8A65|nr:serine O-acetyltransferase EpsC [Paenalcaligenes suwonensis]NHC61485.1 serine acetyltransferase [Paenalcaligenes suwonensis]